MSSTRGKAGSARHERPSHSEDEDKNLRKETRHYCCVCNVRANSERQLHQHLKGINHKITMLKLREDGSGASEQSYRGERAREQDGEPGGLFYAILFVALLITLYLYLYLSLKIIHNFIDL